MKHKNIFLSYRVRHFLRSFYDKIEPIMRQKGCEKMLRSNERIVYEMRGEDLIVRIKGEIDHHSAVLVRTGIDEEIMIRRPKQVLLELSSVDFMDSSGLGLIMGRYALIKQFGGTLSVLNPSLAVVKIMKLAGMERMVPIKKTKENQD